MTAKAPKMAFIGLGTMGAPMAHNLIAQGFDLSVCDENAAALVGFEGVARFVTRDPAEAARDCNFIMTILPTSDIVETVLFGEEGALSTAAPNCLVIEMSTGSYSKLMQMASRLKALGHRLIDAPVGRSKREAATGNLLVMAGGSEADIAQATPLFDAVGDTCVHMGPQGSGLKIKLVNNYMSMINTVLTGEVLALAQHVGLDLEKAVSVMSTTAAGMGQLNTNYPQKVLAGDLSPDFPIFMAIKDLTMALELAQTSESPARFGKLARTILRDAEAHGMGDLDQTAVLKFLEKAGG